MQRDNKIDFYKGMLMWGVIWGHTITCLLQGAPNEVGIHPIFRTYDMPFFMLLSGFFLSKSMEKYKLFSILKNKLTTIAIPTLLWGMLVTKFQNGFTSYYFLWAVFYSSCVVCVINKIMKNKVLQFIIYLLLIVALHIQSYSLYNLPYLFPYFILGYYGYNLIFSTKINGLWVLSLYVLGLCFWKVSFTIWNAGANILDGGEMLLFIQVSQVPNLLVLIDRFQRND